MRIVGRGWPPPLVDFENWGNPLDTFRISVGYPMVVVVV